jgi:uncharacterized membrane protein YqjE
VAEQDTHEPKDRAPGLFESIRALLASLVAIAHTRLDLFGTEIEEQVDRLASILLWGLAALLTAFLAIVLSSITLIVVYWETNRVTVAFGLTVGSLLITAFAIYGFVNRLRERPRLFGSTLDELAKDHERLTDQ